MAIEGLSKPLRLACTVKPITGEPFIDLEDICNYVVKYEASLKCTYLDRQGPQGKKKEILHHQAYPQLAGVGGEAIQPGGFLSPSAPRLGVVGSLLLGIGRGQKIDSRKFMSPDRECYFCHQLAMQLGNV